MSELKEIRDQLAALNSKVDEKAKDLEGKMDKNTAITQQGFSKMNGRVKKLEIKQAYREGLEKAATVVVAPDGDWKSATFKLIGLIGAIVAFASIAAGVVAKVIQ